MSNEPEPQETTEETMSEERKKNGYALLAKIIDKKSGDAQKLARQKEKSTAKIAKRTNQLLSNPYVMSRPQAELKKPTDADLLTPEECICRNLLTAGFVEAFTEFFKITHPKAPGSYHYDYWSTASTDNATPPPPIIPTDKYDFLQAKLVEAEKARRKAQDEALADAYTSLSQYFQSINDMKIAIIYLEKLRDYALFTSDLFREAQALKEIGHLFKEAGNLESSLHFCEECLSVSVSINDGVAEAQAALIDAYRSYSSQLISRGEGAEAIEFLKKSLQVAQSSGVLLSIAICNQELGLCYRQQEQLENAIEHFRNASTLYKGLGNIEGQSAAVSALATTYKYMGNTQQAIDYFKQLHELAAKTGSAKDKALSCLTMGKILWESDKKEEALTWFKRNFDISTELDDIDVLEDSRVSLGVSLANYRMSQFNELVRQRERVGELLNWELDRNEEPFQVKQEEPSS